MSATILQIGSWSSESGRDNSMILLAVASVLGGFLGLAVFLAAGFGWPLAGFMLGGSISALAAGCYLAIKRRAPKIHADSLDGASRESTLAR